MTADSLTPLSFLGLADRNWVKIQIDYKDPNIFQSTGSEEIGRFPDITPRSKGRSAWSHGVGRTPMRNDRPQPHTEMKMIVTILATLSVVASASTPAIENAAKRVQADMATATSATASKATQAMDAAKALSMRLKKAAAPVVSAVKVEADKAKTAAEAEAPAVLEKVAEYKVAEQSVAQQLLSAAARVADAVGKEKQ